MPPTVTLVLCCLTLANLAVTDAAVTATEARAVAASPARLPDGQIRAVLRAALDAQRGRYATTRLVGDVPPPLRGVTEFLLDPEDGRIRFMRNSRRDPVTRQETIEVTEYTRQPARLCSGADRPLDGTLAIHYSHWGGRWQQPFGQVAVTVWLLPVADLLDAPSGVLIDEGIQKVDGRRVRRFAWRLHDPATDAVVRVLSASLDVESLLMIRSSVSVTMEGRTASIDSAWDYPQPAHPLSRPMGVEAPDCV